MRFGEFQLDIVSDGSFWLDGGAMFGVIPKPLWEKVSSPDARNRIHLKMNCLLIRGHNGTNILVDTGCGRKFDEKFARIYGIEHEQKILLELGKLGLQPEDIHIVVNTHLHFDHCGGNTIVQNGKVVPTFPKAQYLVRHGEYDDANNPNERNRASYLPDNWRLLERTKQLSWIERDEEILRGVRLIETAGHTRTHQSVRIEGDQGVAFFFGDLVPTVNHLSPAWIMGYDLYPLTTLATKKKVLAEALAGKWLVIFEHDPTNTWGHLRQHDDSLEFCPLMLLA